MKRALLIAGGTVGGLGAVLSVTPPQLGSQGLTNLASSAKGAGSGTFSTVSSTSTVAVVPQATSTVVKASASSATPSANRTATPKATVKKKAAHKKAVVKATKKAAVKNKSTTTNQTSPTSSTSPTSPTLVATGKKVSGTFAGSSVFVNYGTVQVEITVVDGKITDARALQAPTGRSDRFTQYALPVLRQQTLAAQSASIQGASGASYTSWGWFTSLQVAIVKAGL